MKKYFITAYKGFAVECSSIRNLIDALSTVIKVTQYLIVFPYRDISCKSSDADITIWIDKMSRIFLNSDNKIHCLNYPFTVYEQNGILQFFCLNKEIDGMSMDIILSILKRFDFIQKSIENTLDCFFEVMDDFSVKTNSDMQFYWNLLTYLITQESGYLRYDHDETTDTILHPVNHIDFFYSTSNTFKVGLKTPINWTDMKEIVDVNDICYILFKTPCS